jgi:hypothetical protein
MLIESEVTIVGRVRCDVMAPVQRHSASVTCSELYLVLNIILTTRTERIQKGKM